MPVVKACHKVTKPIIINEKNRTDKNLAKIVAAFEFNRIPTNSNDVVIAFKITASF